MEDLKPKKNLEERLESMIIEEKEFESKETIEPLKDKPSNFVASPSLGDIQKISQSTFSFFSIYLFTFIYYYFFLKKNKI